MNYDELRKEIEKLQTLTQEALKSGSAMAYLRSAMAYLIMLDELTDKLLKAIERPNGQYLIEQDNIFASIHSLLSLPQNQIDPILKQATAALIKKLKDEIPQEEGLRV